MTGLISQSRFQSDETEEVAQASEMQRKGKGKVPYEKWMSEEQTFLVDLWAEKHERLESKEIARNKITTKYNMLFTIVDRIVQL